MSQALYRKWRPQSWDEVVGQQHVVRTLCNAVSGGHLAHAYLFAGPRGTGKTTAARLLAKSVNCLDPDLAKRPCNRCEHCRAVNENRFLDLIEIDAASQTGVDDVRDLRDKINFTPNQGKYKIYIIDEVHMFSTNAFNALLKTLEEPPPHAIFILATTEIHKIPATVLSRCQRHEFRRVPVDEITAQLEKIANQEKINAEPEALTAIARQATGSLRDAISLLDQLASAGQEITVGLTQAVLGTATSQTVIDVIDAIRQRQPAQGLDALHTALDAGTDARTLARQLVDYLRALMLMQLGNAGQVDMTADARARALVHAREFSQSNVLRMVRLFNSAAAEQRSNWQPALPLEIALAESIEADPAFSQPAGPVVEKGSPPAVPDGKPATPVPALKEGQPDGAREDVQENDLARVIKNWRQVCAATKSENPSLNALLNSSKVLDVKKGGLVLGFASEILREKADKPELLELIHQAVLQTTGLDLKIRCMVSNTKRPIPSDVKADGMVAAALKKGGEIVDIHD